MTLPLSHTSFLCDNLPGYIRLIMHMGHGFLWQSFLEILVEPLYSAFYDNHCLSGCLCYFKRLQVVSRQTVYASHYEDKTPYFFWCCDLPTQL